MQPDNIKENWQAIFDSHNTNKDADFKPLPDLINRTVHANTFEYLKELKPNMFNLVVTDPPYYLPATHSVGREVYTRTLSDETMLEEFFKGICALLHQTTTTDGAWYLFCNEDSMPSLHRAVRPYCKDTRVLIWDKQTSKLGYTWRHQYEMILFVTRPGFTQIPTGDGDILRFKAVPHDKKVHPAQKPLSILEKIISKHGKKNLVLDPFSGSGSTALAALNTGNYYHAIEMEQKYYNSMLDRLSSSSSSSGKE